MNIDMNEEKNESILQFKNIHAIPSFHSRVQFAIEVRRAFFELKPDVIVVELPEALKDKVIEGINRLPYISVIGYEQASARKMSYVPIDPGDSIIEAIRIGIENDIPVEFIDLDVTRYRQKAYDIKFLNEYMISKIGLEKYYLTMVNFVRKSNPGTKDYDRERYMADRLKDLMKNYKRILYVLGLAHWERVRGFLSRNIKPVEQTIEREHIEVFNLSKKSFREVLRELPYITYLYEISRNNLSEGQSFDKLDGFKTIYLNAKENYYKEFGENLSLHDMKIIMQFARNYALVENSLIPSLFHLVMSAKNIHDDDYAGEVYDIAISYPFYKKDDKYREIEIKQRRGQLDNRIIPLRRRLPVGEVDKRKIPIKRRPKEEEEGLWKKIWERESEGIFSYPPEDIKFENYMDFIRKKALKMLLEENIKIEEFKTSILDGISIKDTIRNWHLNKKIYVREELPLRGEIGPVIVIFEEDDTLNNIFDYQLTWIHEHEEESDLLLYATAPGLKIIGPGISRGTFGGLVSFFPPLDYIPYLTSYDWVEKKYLTKSESLLLSAIYNATEKQKYIVYVANRNPDPYLKSLANREGKYIIFLPLSSFNPMSIKKLRIVHYLNSKKARKHANQFIFL
ncbi:MAG: hypothetical protein EAX96_16800 [Candidatus Lokiarchaeota archaeon]|nr:hypothetical protein [Candidatus Lokiarchaeota archaeon]